MVGACAAYANPVTTYSFTGVCSDCSGDASAQLVLSGYTLGDSITSSEFVSFTYDGTNLFPSYTFGSADLASISGSLPASLPGTADLSVTCFEAAGCPGARALLTFSSTTSGTWSLSSSGGGADQGIDGAWSLTSAPEPADGFLLATGLLLLAAGRRWNAARARKA